MIDPTLFNNSSVSYVGTPASAVPPDLWVVSPGSFVAVAALVGAVAFGIGWLSGYGWRGKHGI